MPGMMQGSWGYGWEQAPFLMQWAPFFGIGIVSLLLWTLAWKGWALWLAARRGEKIWFAVFLVVNTLGILEIIYIFLIAKRSETSATTKPADSIHGTN